jgi:RNA polymerase sigma factor (TIGR02999 family)
MSEPSQLRPPSPQSGEITRLLALVRRGDRQAEGPLLDALYSDLKKLAARFLFQEGNAQTLTPTALVNEAYLRIFGATPPDIKDRHHFLALSCQVMRRLLVDRARSRNRQKRGAGKAETLTDFLAVVEDNPDQILAVVQSLGRLAAFAPRAAKVVEMRYFGGLEDAEIAEVLETSVRTIRRDWAMSRAWFLSELNSSTSSSSLAK